MTANCDGKAVLEYERIGGRSGGSRVYIKNTSPNQRIEVTCEVSFPFDGEGRKEYDIKKLAPGQRIHIGATLRGTQEFNHEIVGCRELD